MEKYRFETEPTKKKEGGHGEDINTLVIDAITTPVQLGKSLKTVFKNKYGIEITTRYIKTVRGLDNSYYEISSFQSGASFRK